MVLGSIRQNDIAKSSIRAKLYSLGIFRFKYLSIVYYMGFAGGSNGLRGAQRQCEIQPLPSRTYKTVEERRFTGLKQAPGTAKQSMTEGANAWFEQHCSRRTSQE